MPKFYFHITDGQKTHPDPNGADLVDEKCAGAFARMLADGLLNDEKYSTYYVDVRDENDRPVMKLYIATRH